MVRSAASSVVFATLLGAPGCAHHPCPPPADTLAGLDTFTTELSLDSSGTLRIIVLGKLPASRIPLLVECDCLPAPAVVLTNDHGVGTLPNVRAGRYPVTISYPSNGERLRSITVEPGVNEVLVETTDAAMLPIRMPAWPADTLPADVVLRYETTACLGPCVAFVATLHDDGRVRVRYPDGSDASWTIRPRAAARASSAARCLTRGVSYGTRMTTDAPSVHVLARDGDVVGAYDRHASDARVPRETRQLARRLRRTLRLRPAVSRS